MADTLASALLAVVADVAPAEHPKQCARMAQGLLMQALAPVLRLNCSGGAANGSGSGSGLSPRLQRLLEVRTGQDAA